MNRCVLASVIALALSACDSDSIVAVQDPMAEQNNDQTVVGVETGGNTDVSDSGNTNSGNTDSGDTGTSDSGDTGTSDSGSTGSNDSGNSGSSSSDSSNTSGDGSSGSNTMNDGANDSGNGSGNVSNHDKNDDDASGDTSDDGVKGDDTNYDNSNDNDDGVKGDDSNDNDGAISDDAGSSTSDGGNVTDDSGSSTSDGNVTDDSGSSTSDGGVTDDSGSSTSDGGVTDDSGSSTSDGGVTDDSGSSTSDGGTNDDSGSSTSDGGTDDSDNTDNGDTDTNTNTDTNTDGGSFQSDSTGGSVVYQSSLASSNSQQKCTTLSEQNNFSDIWFGDFILHNNAWRPWRAFEGYEWEQCIYTNQNGAVAGWNYDWGPGRQFVNGNPNPSGDYYVRSYPELIYGVKDEYRTSAPKSRTGMPVRFGDMLNISIDYSYDGPQYGEPRTVDASNNPRFPNGSTISGERNIAIESFFYNADENGQCSEGIVTRAGGSNHTYEVMVWLDAGAERLPAGPGDFVTNVSIRGEAFKVYTKGADPRYVAFVAQNPQSSGTVYWNDFTDWAKTYAHRVQEEFGARSNSVQMQDDWCMANIIVGTEIFWGSGNLDLYNWTITQRQ